MALWDEILSPRTAAQRVWVWQDGAYRQRSYADSFSAGRRVAAALRARGIGAGDVVGAVITNSTPAVHGFLGAWWAGAAVASLPIIARGQSLPDYVQQLRRACASVGARCLLIEARFAPFLLEHGLTDPEIVTYESLEEHTGVADPEPPEPDEVMFIQFSSGTTAAPSGVELTGRAIEAQLRALADRVGIDPARDIGAMWLPLSHDMGFFAGNILVWYTGMAGVLSSPERFLAEPFTWFEDCARFGATITIGPSFAFHLAGRTRRRDGLPGRLELRLCITGGEVVVPEHLRSCTETFAADGLRLDSFTAAYGMAEATLGVTVGDPDRAPDTVWVRSEGLYDGALALSEPGDPEGRELISCGPPLPGFSVEVSGTVGEVHVSGPSVARGYHGDPEKTAARFRDGTFATGDLGFVHDGQLYVVGRLDDRLIVAGRNIDVAGLEHEIAADEGVRRGNLAVVDVRQGASQRIVVVAELTGTVPADELLGRVRETAARRHGLRVDRLVALESGQFPKTPSGKAQRYRCRALALAAQESS